MKNSFPTIGVTPAQVTVSSLLPLPSLRSLFSPSPECLEDPLHWAPHLHRTSISKSALFLFENF